MKTKLILIAPLASFILSCGSPKGKDTVIGKVALTSIGGKDTLFVQEIGSLDQEIVYVCPDHVKEDVAVFTLQLGLNTIQIPVPVQTGEKNRYLMDPKSLDGKVTGRFVHFSSNAYLDDYEELLASAERSEGTGDTARAINSFVADLYRFSLKYPRSSMIGYHVFSTETNGQVAVFEQFLSKSSAMKWKKLQVKSDDVFSRELKRMKDAGTNMNCAKNASDHLLFQSSNSSIHPSLLEGNIKVIIFWATWCGPCKPQMKMLANLNRKKYSDGPVLFVGVSSESDRKLVFSWMEQNHSKYNGLVFFHDNHFCMSNNYQITQYPTILVFDQKDKLIKRDVSIQEVEAVVDSLLKK